MEMYEDRSAMFQQSGDLVHHGVKGMKWGVRRYQNKSGALTPAGRDRYRMRYDNKAMNTARNDIRKARKSGDKDARTAAKAKYKDMVRSNKQEFDMRRDKINANRSAGSKVAMTLLAGPFANRSYNAARAAGMSKADAAASTFVTAYLNGPIGSLSVAASYKSMTARGYNTNYYK